MAGIDAYTKLMLHMDGTDGSTTFTDSALNPATITAVGNAQIDTAQSVFGGASGLFDGSGDRLTVPDSNDWDFGTSDFTIDFRVRFNTLAGGHRCVFEIGNYTSSGIIFQRNTDGNLYYAQDNSLKSIAWTPSLSTWYHIALVRIGRYTYMYVDGSLFTTFDFTSTQNLAANAGVSIGYGNTGTNYFDGWLDEFRISKGTARWTAAFTPPTEAYSTNNSQTSVLAPARQYTRTNTEYHSITDASQSGLDPGDADFYMAGWVNMDSFPTLNVIFGKWINNGSSNAYLLDYYNTAPGFRFTVTSGGLYNSGTTTATYSISGATGTWYFVEAYHDSVNNRIGICVNRGTDTTANTSAGVYGAGTAAVTMGALDSGSGHQYDGRIGVFLFTSGIPTSGERDSLYNSGNGVLYTSKPTLSSATYVSWWDGAETSGRRVDAHGTNHLTDNNTVTSAAGKVTYTADDASQFTAANSESLSVLDNASISYSGDYSWAGWYYADSLAGGGSYNALATKGYPDGNTYEWALGYAGTQTQFYHLVAHNGTTATNILLYSTSFGSPSTGRWYFVVGTWDATTHTATICVNDGTVDSSTNAGVTPTDTSARLQIGATNNNAYTWNGRQQNLSFWKKKLSASEITQLYNRGFGLRYSSYDAGLLTSLISHWPLTEASGTREDVHGSNDLTDNNTVTGALGVAYVPSAPADATISTYDAVTIAENVSAEVVTPVVGGVTDYAMYVFEY